MRVLPTLALIKTDSICWENGLGIKRRPCDALAERAVAGESAHWGFGYGESDLAAEAAAFNKSWHFGTFLGFGKSAEFGIGPSLP